MYLRQSAGSGVPNYHAAIFNFFNQSGNPIARQITLGDAFSDSPVELNPGESAFARLGWFMFNIDDCQSQVIRPVLDFDNDPACVVPDPEENDPDTVLAAIAALPEQCLGEPFDDPCATFQEPPLRYDFGTGTAATTKILKNEITQGFALDGAPLKSTVETTSIFKYVLGAADPTIAPTLICKDELYYAPIYAYFVYGYQIPSQSGQCISKANGAMVTPLAPGEHQLEFLSTVGGEIQSFPPVTIIQH